MPKLASDESDQPEEMLQPPRKPNLCTRLRGCPTCVIRAAEYIVFLAIIISFFAAALPPRHLHQFTRHIHIADKLCVYPAILEQRPALLLFYIIIRRQSGSHEGDNSQTTPVSAIQIDAVHRLSAAARAAAAFSACFRASHLTIILMRMR